MPVAELIAEPNHFLSCGSVISLVPDDNTLPVNGHADLIWSRLGRFENRWVPCIRVFAGAIHCGIALLRDLDSPLSSSAPRPSS